MNIINTRVKKINGKIESTIQYSNGVKEIKVFDTLSEHFEYCKKQEIVQIQILPLCIQWKKQRKIR